MILDTCLIESILSLPVGTFFNTPKKTFILTLWKKPAGQENTRQEHPVFAYLCSSIGENIDTYRFDLLENDLHAAVDLYNIYKVNRESPVALGAIQADRRAKLLPICRFAPAVSWNIDEDWSDQEKVALGIKKEDNIMSLDEFQNFISGLVSDIEDFKEAVECLKRTM